MADFFLHCFRLGYVLLFCDCAQGRMSHISAVDACGKLAVGYRFNEADLWTTQGPSTACIGSLRSPMHSARDDKRLAETSQSRGLSVRMDLPVVL